MRALLLRHAIAEDTPPRGGGDRARALTSEGRQKMELGARALAALVPDLERVVASPLVRARQTAEILLRAYPSPPTLLELADLAPEGASSDVLRFLEGQGTRSAIALVGHEPNLSLLEAFLLTGRDRPLSVFKKGGAALIEFPARPAAGDAVLLWHLTPGQLRELAR